MQDVGNSFLGQAFGGAFFEKGLTACTLQNSCEHFACFFSMKTWISFQKHLALVHVHQALDRHGLGVQRWFDGAARYPRIAGCCFCQALAYHRRAIRFEQPAWKSWQIPAFQDPFGDLCRLQSSTPFYVWRQTSTLQQSKSRSFSCSFTRRWIRCPNRAKNTL